MGVRNVMKVFGSRVPTNSPAKIVSARDVPHENGQPDRVTERSIRAIVGFCTPPNKALGCRESG